jgi:GT2 family glycosyltransferase
MRIVTKISFIVVNYNGLEDSCELIESIYSNIPASCDYEIILVDNGSKQDESLHVKEKFPSVIAIRSEKNLGFAGGNNLGIKSSSGNYLFLINNDTLLFDDSMLKLVDFMDKNSQAAAVSPKIYFPGEPKIIQYAGFTPMSRITLRNRSIGRGEKDDGSYNYENKTFATHGAAMLVRREVVDRIGYMPEVYFLYYEEIDWCMNMKRHGYELWYVPSSSIVHKESRTTGEDSPLKRYYMTRNRLLFARRNLSKGFANLSICYQIVVANLKAVCLSIIRGRADLVRATLSGILDYYRLPDKYEGLKL